MLESYQYSAVSAKLRAMYSRHLTNKDYKNLSLKSSVSEIVSYLKNETMYSDVLGEVNERTLHRGTLEELLRKYLFGEFSRMYKFVYGSKRNMVWFLCMIEEFAFIKHVFRRLYSGEIRCEMGCEIIPLSDFLLKHTKIDVQKILTSRDLGEFYEGLEGTPYYKILKSFDFRKGDVNLFDLEMALDRYYYKAMFDSKDNFLDKADAEGMRLIVGSEIDILNIMWIYRAKKYFNVPNEIIYSYLIDGYYKITKKDIVAMVEAEDADAVKNYVVGTKYSSLFENLNGRFAEENYNKIIYKISKRILASGAGAGMAGIFAYFKLKTNEIRNIIVIVESIRYNLSSDAVLEHICS